MFMRLFVILVLTAALTACQREGDSPPASGFKSTATSPQTLPEAEPISAAPFLSEPLRVNLVEVTSEALPVWRHYRKNRPLLAIVAHSPAMAPIPAEVLAESRDLLADADDATLRFRTGLSDTDPLLLPPMAVSAALDAAWLDGVVWIFPTSSTPETLNSELFIGQLLEIGLATPEEAQGLSFANGVFSGTLRGKTFIAAPLAALPAIDRPILLHIDCDYFKTLYKGEIKTPLYPLLIDTLVAIKERGWQVLEVTVARSTLGAGLPLATRFIAGQIAGITTDPEMLGRPVPNNWAERANALYLENFLQKDKVRDIYLELIKIDPADPSLHFALYQILRQYAKGGDEALKHLAVAVSIDPVYGLEYLNLAELAIQKQLPDQAARMVQLARAARPDDPFVTMMAARTLVNAGRHDGDEELRAALLRLNWSPFYYPELAADRDNLLQMLGPP
jgi:hypothetical protein